MLFDVILLFLVTVDSALAFASKYAYMSSGKLAYKSYNSQGDKIIDFSFVGFKHGAVAIPNVPVVKTISPRGNGQSDVSTIQQTINSMAQHPKDAKTGFTGAILLNAGEYKIDSTIYLNISGIVLRGVGSNKTVLYGSGRYAYPLIEAGYKEATHKYSGKVLEINGYAPTRSTTLNVTGAKSNFKAGDQVFIFARKNEAWIKATGMDMLNYYAPSSSKDSVVDWAPFDSRHERILTSVSDNAVSFDVPLVEAIDPQWGGGYIRKYSFDETLVVDHVGIEDLDSYSYFDKSVTLPYSSKNSTRYYADEQHASHLIVFYASFDSFARRISGRYFNHFVAIKSYSKRISILDARHEQPVSRLEGERRYTYHLYKASEVLFANCFASGARHAMIWGSRTTGPNVFYNCKAVENYASSEPHDRWSVGGLFDNCDAEIAIQNRLYYGTGHGWGGANFVAWNTNGNLQLHSPVTDWNFAIGHRGAKVKPTFEYAPGGVDRSWETSSHGDVIEPKSLYQAQLADRLATF